MFVPPQRRLGPRIIIIALAIMIFAMVYLLVQRRNQKPVKESPVQQLQQEIGFGSGFAPR
jgi:preprotein translocase subunit YajC